MAIRGFEDGILSIFANSLAGAGEKLGKGVAAVADAMGGDTERSSGSSFGLGGLVSSAKDAFGFGKGSDEPARAAAPSPVMEVQTPTASLGKYEVSMNDLGNITPPPVGMVAARGAGMNMNA